MIQIKRAGIALAVALLVGCASAPPVNGEWDLMLMAAEGSTGFPINIEASGDQANASGGGSDFTGTWVDGELNLKGDYFVPEAGYSAELDMTVRIVDDQLKGTATWDQFEADVTGDRAE